MKIMRCLKSLPCLVVLTLGCSFGDKTDPPGEDAAAGSGGSAPEDGGAGSDGSPDNDGASGNDATPNDSTIASDVVYPPPGTEWPTPSGPVDLAPAPSPDIEPILALTSQMIWDTESVTIEGEVSDLTLFASATWSLDGSEPEALSVDSEGKFSFPVVLTPGWHSVRLVAKTPSDEERASVEYVAYDTNEPTSFSKIEAAVQAGNISEEMGLVFKVYALHRDRRLPDEYRGFDALSVMTPIVRQMAAQFDSLSPQAQQLLEPFLMPPFYKGSWWGQANNPTREYCPPTRMFGCIDACMSTDWEFVDGEFVRVWWRKAFEADKGNAAALLATVEGQTKAWVKLYGVMKRVPKSDEGNSCNGGNGKLDIILAPIEGEGTTTPYNLMSLPSPTFIVINAYLPLAKQQGAVAHELMHAFVYAQKIAAGNMNSYFTLSESTANWAADYVWRKSNQWEHQYKQYYAFHVKEPFNKAEPPHRGYGAYLFPLFLDRNGLGPDIIRTMWQHAESENEMDAIVNGINEKGKFNDQWKQFGAALWNDYGASTGKFVKWDNLRGISNIELGDMFINGTEEENQLASELEPTSFRYHAWKIEPGSKVHQMVLLNGLTNRLKREEVLSKDVIMYTTADVLYKPSTAEIPKTVGLQYIVRRNGKWEPAVDISEKSPSYKAWCRDTEADRIDAIVVVMSYSDHKGSGPFKEDGDQTRMAISNMVCDEADVTADLKRVTTDPADHLTVTGKMGRSGDMTIPWGSGGTAVLGFTLKGASGTMDHSIVGTDTCKTESYWNGPFDKSTSNPLYSLGFAHGTQAHSYIYWGLPADSVSTSITNSCGGGWAISVGQYWKFAACTEGGLLIKADSKGHYAGQASKSFGSPESQGSWSIKGTKDL